MAAENQLHVTFRDEDIESLRKQMLSFARLQLDDEYLAEDAVQEALAGALKNASSFSRQSTLKTWVFSILRRKIADVLRGQYREPVREACKECST
ncbi:MAG: sigma-70 family RNA polymerase sigma factor, partial [Pseudomonadota bacterium]|nr:sigma-70 family RNA polymerase sigma factor [Pseudomonadota bacterium]